MTDQKERQDIDTCIQCHQCRDHCDFLTKYKIDIGDEEELREHAFSCFLCGKCTDVCPIHIDGRAEVLRLRQERVAAGEQADVEKKNKGLLKEKRDYVFRNYKHKTEGTVFFPGCNFPSLFPKTSDKVIQLLEEQGIGTIYDCCGKPVAELGLKEDEERIIGDLRSRLQENHITELVTACPNCREFFGDRLGIPVVSIYTKLAELGLGQEITGPRTLYLPCPDRYTRRWVEEIKNFCTGELTLIDSVQCCGLGGCAAGTEPEISKGFTRKVQTAVSQTTGGSAELRSYCASCAGQMARNGLKDVRHILSEILGMEEKPDTLKSYLNRRKTKRK